MAFEMKEKKEAIKVMLRFRPINKPEKKAELLNKHVADTNIQKKIKFVNDNELHLMSNKGKKSRLYSFGFDKIFAGNTTQKKLFHYVSEPLINSMIKGYNGSILVFGQSGSGKTYSMYGPEKNKNNMKINEFGLMPMSLAYLFSIFNDKDGVFMNHNSINDYSIQLQFIEIYNEKLRDLLDITNSPYIKQTKSKQGKWSAELGNIFTKEIYNLEEGLALMHKAIKNRTVATTNSNQSSSRSHLLMRLHLKIILKNGKQRVGVGSFADLAGSEIVKKTNAIGLELKAAGNILKSLTCLSNVIYALEKGKKHIPFKDSKLTYLLKNSLGGNCKTKLLLCCSPHIYNRDETLRTLEFGKRCKKIKTTTKVNESTTQAQIKKDNAMLKREIQKLKQDLLNFNESNQNVGSIMQAELDKIKIQNEQLKGVIQEYEMQFDELEMSLKESIEKEDDLAVKYNELVIKYTSLSSQDDFVNALKVENETLKTDNLKLKSDLKVSQKNTILNGMEKKEEIRNKKLHKQKHIASLKQTTELNVSIEGLRKEIKALYDKTNKLELNEIKLKREIDILTKNTKLNNNANKILQNHNDTLNKEKNEFQYRINNLEIMCEEKDNIIKKLKIRNAKLIKRLTIERPETNFDATVNYNDSDSNNIPPAPPSEDIPDDLMKRYTEKDKYFYSNKELGLQKTDRKIVRSQTKTLRDMFEEERQSRKFSNGDKVPSNQKKKQQNRRLLGFKKHKTGLNNNKFPYQNNTMNLCDEKDFILNNNPMSMTLPYNAVNISTMVMNENNKKKKQTKNKSLTNIPSPPKPTTSNNILKSYENNLFVHRGSIVTTWTDAPRTPPPKPQKPLPILTKGKTYNPSKKFKFNSHNKSNGNSNANNNCSINNINDVYKLYMNNYNAKPSPTQFIKFSKSHGIPLKFIQVRNYLKTK